MLPRYKHGYTTRVSILLERSSKKSLLDKIASRAAQFPSSLYIFKVSAMSRLPITRVYTLQIYITFNGSDQLTNTFAKQRSNNTFAKRGHLLLNNVGFCSPNMLCSDKARGIALSSSAVD